MIISVASGKGGTGKTTSSNQPGRGFRVEGATVGLRCGGTELPYSGEAHFGDFGNRDSTSARSR